MKCARRSPSAAIVKKKIEHCTNANASNVSIAAAKPATAAVQALSSGS